MLFAATGQAVVFLTTMYAGLAIGLLYDVLRAARRVLRAGAALTAFSDLAFSAAAAAIFLYSLIIANNGRMHGYTVMGALCGVFLYFCGLSPLLLPLLSKTGSIIMRVILKIAKSRVLEKILK